MTATKTLPIILRLNSGTPGNSASGLTMDKLAHRRSGKTKHNPNSLDFTILGACAGASMNSVDCVLVRYRQQSREEQLRMDFIQYEEITVPVQIRSPILNLLRDYQRNPHAMLRVQNMIGHMISTAMKCFCKNHNIPLDSVALAAAQVDSIPPSVLPSSVGASWQSEIDPKSQTWTGIIAEETGITTITSLPTNRPSWIAHEPSYLASMDDLFLRDATKFRVCITVDDFLAITVIPPKESSREIVSTPFAQCGPGTMFIDYAMRYATSNRIENDRDGTYGESGTVNEHIVDRFLKTYDYSRRPLPVIMAVEMFGQHEIQGVVDECLFLGMSDHDIVATITRITSDNIVSQYNKIMRASFPGQKVYELFICGRGANNVKIVDRLEEMLPDEIITKPFEDIGIPGEAKSAVCCAHMAFGIALRHTELELGLRVNQSEDPGPEKLVKGREWEAFCEKMSMFSEGKELPPVRDIVVNRR